MGPNNCIKTKQHEGISDYRSFSSDIAILFLQ